MIEMTCPHCGQALQIADEYAGKAGRCKRCQKAITAPGIDPASAFVPVDVANVEIDADKVVPPRAHIEEGDAGTEAPTLTPQQKGCFGCAAVIGIPMAGLFIYAMISDSTRNSRIEDAMRGQPDYRMTANDLLRIVDVNKFAAQKRYDDKVLELEGTISSVSITTLTHIVYLGPAASPDAPVWCYFDEKWNSRIASLRAGQFVKIRGVASVGIGPTMLERCELSGTNSGHGPSSPDSTSEWHSGGTLHNATVSEWRSATHRNKLATASDWLAATTWKGRLNTPGDIARFKIKSQILTDAVDEVAEDAATVGLLKVKEIAAFIVTAANDLGPDSK